MVVVQLHLVNPLEVWAGTVLPSISVSLADGCSVPLPTVGLFWSVSAPYLPVTVAQRQPEPTAQLSRS